MKKRSLKQSINISKDCLDTGKQKRNKEIIYLTAAGFSGEELSKLYNLTRMRIHQIKSANRDKISMYKKIRNKNILKIIGYIDSLKE